MSILKQNALSIFGITDITEGDFFNKEEREKSEQLQILREENNFLFATEDVLPDVPRIERYYRSDCIPRVSLYIQLDGRLPYVEFSFKALRAVLLGRRAVDGSNKRKRSQSRSRKFEITTLSTSMLAFFATVVSGF